MTKVTCNMMENCYSSVQGEFTVIMHCNNNFSMTQILSLNIVLQIFIYVATSQNLQS